MGVRGLTTFVESIDAAWETIVLPIVEGADGDIASANGNAPRLVIDGLALMYHLYQRSKLNYSWGGQYEEFYCLVAHHFHMLSAAFDVFVMFDGVNPEQKEREMRTRNAERSKRLVRLMRERGEDTTGCFVMPVLATKTFYLCLADLAARGRRVRYVVADYEADSAVAALAKWNQCCAVSRDSDYYIFDIPQGYVPIDSLVVGTDRIQARNYSVRRMAEFLRLPLPLFPLWATLIGNDYTRGESGLLNTMRRGMCDEATRSGAGGDSRPIAIMAHAIAAAAGPAISVDAALDAALGFARASLAEDAEYDAAQADERIGRLRTTICESMEQYQLRMDLISGIFADPPATELPLPPGWDPTPAVYPPHVISGYRQGAIDKAMTVAFIRQYWCHTLSEIDSQPSAWLLSRPLRQVLYGMILGPASDDTVVEYLRQDEAYGPENVATVRTLATSVAGQTVSVPSLFALDALDMAARAHFLLCALRSDGIEPRIRTLPRGAQLATACLRYMLATSLEQGETWRGFEVAIYVACIARRTPLVASNKPKPLPHELVPYVAHRASMWLATVKTADELNALLASPFRALRPWEVFDGQFFHSVYHFVGVKSIDVTKIVSQVVYGMDLFWAIYRTAVSGLTGIREHIKPPEKPT